MSKRQPARRVRIEDVAVRAGVSIGTVSHALNRPYKVREETLARVQQAVAELGYVADRRASQLAGATSSTLGFVVTDLSNSFFLDMARGAEQEAEAAGLTMLLANADMQLQKEQTYLALFDEERVAGILLAPMPTPTADALGAHRWHSQVVVLNSHAAGRCSVAVDDEAGGYLAARHLIESGRRRLVFAGGPMSLTPLRARREGVVRAVAETNGAVQLGFVQTDEVQADDGRRVGEQVAALPPDRQPDGIVAGADLLAAGITRALHAASDLRVGRDLGLVGYDDNRAAWDSPVPLTTLAQPGEAMGRAAVRLLLEDIRVGGEHEHEHEDVLLQPTLVVRESSAAPAP